MTLIVVWVNILFLLGTLPYLLVFMLKYLIKNSFELTLAFSIANISIMLSHGANIFIYFHFNNMFRQILISYFSCLCIKIDRYLK